jgi:UDP-hydrolysing UDP-N-acetyl-D-glucosamine 2-epimerase
VLFATGSRADYGLLVPVINAARADSRLVVLVAACGEHLLGPARTVRQVEADGAVDARVPMQRLSDRGRPDHALALARGVAGFARAIKDLDPDWVVVLGDRVEALAAASAASVSGVGLCHIHGGDRAEGIADEAMRHAITKLANLHCAATRASADRIVAMGEDPASVHVTGSPAVDGLRKIKALDARAVASLARATPDVLAPSALRAVVLVHPDGRGPRELRAMARGAVLLAWSLGAVPLVLAPNSDPGREHIVGAYDGLARSSPLARGLMVRLDHLARETFVALLKRLATQTPLGVLIGNSSAGLIEAAAIGLTSVNFGPRQNGRERADNVIDVPEPSGRALALASDLLMVLLGEGAGGGGGGPEPSALFGVGRAGLTIARLLATRSPTIRKRNAY